MTRVDFYILPQDDIQQRHLFACRLTEKAYKLGHGIYIHNDDDAQANAIDQLLWRFRNSSFIPHQFTGDSSETGANTPVQIGCTSTVCVDTAPTGLLVNLAHSVPEFFSRFDRVCEIVVQHPQIQEATRANYRFYRERGYPLQTHDLRK